MTISGVGVSNSHYSFMGDDDSSIDQQLEDQTYPLDSLYAADQRRDEDASNSWYTN